MAMPTHSNIQYFERQQQDLNYPISEKAMYSMAKQGQERYTRYVPRYYAILRSLYSVSQIDLKGVQIDDEVESLSQKQANLTCHTFDSYLCKWNSRAIDDLKGHTVYIEVLSMVPNKFMTLLYQKF